MPQPHIFKLMLKIYRCVKNNLISQGFGIKGTAPNLLPMYNQLQLTAHDGIDFVIKCKDNKAKTGGQCEMVYSGVATDLKVTRINDDIKTGYGVIACTLDGRYKFLWWHLDSILVKEGQIIGGETPIGVGGNTGFSTGAHVHFGMYDYNEPYDNGYHGAIDPEPYFVNIFILDYIETLKTQIGLIQKIIEAIKKLFK